jgi:hypothetical protein
VYRHGDRIHAAPYVVGSSTSAHVGFAAIRAVHVEYLAITSVQVNWACEPPMGEST